MPNWSIDQTTSFFLTWDLTKSGLGANAVMTRINTGSVITGTNAGNGLVNRTQIEIVPNTLADISQYVWFVAGAPMDPDVYWSEFFNPDGSMKKLPANGVVGGVTPTLFVNGKAAVWNAGTNSGGGAGVLTKLGEDFTDVV